MSVVRPTVIAVASGKGGTGKTTIAAHLALVSSRLRNTLLVDLDVEAPDSLAYFPDAERIGGPEPVSIPIPRFAQEPCVGCGACAKACRFGAIFAIGRSVVVNDKLCKGCGRCVAVCPAGALAESEIQVGTTSLFRAKELELLEGRMVIGDIRSTAVIEAAKRRAARLDVALQVRDCPPGVSCPATHALEGADYVVLIAEPTEFSRHDLRAALRLVRARGMKAGVVVNKEGFGNADIERLCAEYGVPVVARLPFTKERAVSGAAARLWEGDHDLMHELEKILVTALAKAIPEGAI